MSKLTSIDNNICWDIMLLKIVIFNDDFIIFFSRRQYDDKSKYLRQIISRREKGGDKRP